MWTAANDQDATKTDVRATDPDTGDQVVLATFTTFEEAWAWLVARSAS